MEIQKLLSGVRSSSREGNSHICFIVAGNLFFGLRSLWASCDDPHQVWNWQCNLSIGFNEIWERLILLWATQTEHSSAQLCSAVSLAQPTAQSWAGSASATTLSGCNNLTFSSLNESSSCLGDGFAFNIALNAAEIWLQFDTFVGCKSWLTDRSDWPLSLPLFLPLSLWQVSINKAAHWGSALQYHHLAGASIMGHMWRR